MKEKEKKKEIPRCQRCFNRMTILEQEEGKGRWWCFICETPLMDSKLKF